MIQRLAPFAVCAIVMCASLMFGFVVPTSAQSPSPRSSPSTSPCPSSSAAPSSSPSASASPAATTASPLAIFCPQDDRFRFSITLPRLGYRFANDGNLVSRVINFIISILTYVAGGVAFGYIIYGGIRYMTAGGDPSRVDAARKTIIGAIVGIFIVALAYVIVQYLIDTLVGIF